MQNTSFKLWTIIITFIAATTLTIGGLTAYPYLRKKYEFQKIVNQIQNLVDNIQIYKTTHPDYQGLDNNYLLKENLEMKDIINYGDDSMLYSRYGGMFSINSATTNPNEINNKGFAISYLQLNKEMCVQMATYDWRKIKGAKFLGLSASLYMISGDIAEVVEGCNGRYIPNGLIYACPNGNTVGVPAPREQAEMVCECFDGMSCSTILKFE